MHQIKNIKNVKIGKINRIVEVIPILALVFIEFIILVQIISRYIYPLPWTGEVARFCNVWVVFIGAYFAAIYKEHVKIGYFFDLLPNRWQEWLELFTNLLCMFILFIIIFSCMRAIISLYEVKTPAAKIPVPFLFASTLIGSFLMLIYFGIEVLKNILQIITRVKEERKKL